MSSLLHRRGEAVTRRSLAGVLVAVLAVMAALVPLASVEAEGPCSEPGSVAVDSAPPSGVEPPWEVEGKINDYSLENRTISANGMTFWMPADVPVWTNEDGDPDWALPLSEFLDPAHLAEREIFGGTTITTGTTEFTPEGDHFCARLVANHVFVELAENAVVGHLHAVDADAEEPTFTVNGADGVVNVDPRFAAELVDECGSHLDVADLVGKEGTFMEVEGFYDRDLDTLQGVEVGVGFAEPPVDGDCVSIDQARQEEDGRLRVVGSVIPADGVPLPSQVSVVLDGTASGDRDACEGGSGTHTASVSGVDGSYLLSETVDPGVETVCVKSSNANGWATDALVDQR